MDLQPAQLPQYFASLCAFLRWNCGGRGHFNRFLEFRLFQDEDTMPIYAYRCDACGHAKDVLQKMSDAPLTDCPACGAPAFKKQLTAAGFQLKGSGWYVTDFRGGSGGTSAAGTAAKTDAAAPAAGAAAAAPSASSDSASSTSSAAPATSGGCGTSCACH